LKRAKPISVVRHTLPAFLLLLSLLFAACSAALAQQNRARPPISIASGIQHQFVGDLPAIPPSVTRRALPRDFFSRTRAPGDVGVPRQTILLTRQDPSQRNSIIPAPSQDQNPYWSADERYIYFASNRVSDSNTGIGTNFNIFRIFPDGTGVTQITSGTDNKIEPSVSANGNRLAYVASSGTTGYNLFVLDLNTGDIRSLTATNASNLTFIDVRHPTWSPGGVLVAFAGRLVNDVTYHLFQVNIDTGVIQQMTFGPANDYAPAWSPDGRALAFTSNATGFAGATNRSAGTKGNDDIWVMTPGPTNGFAVRITNFVSTVNGTPSNNKNPAWSTSRPDPRGIVPSGSLLLAFASTRADSDPNQPGVPVDVKSTYDIYFMPAFPAETGTNRAFKLRTSTPDTSIDQTDPAHAFDPAFTSNEDWPTWPQFQNSYRIAFQSDRGGNLNLWASTIFDLNAPTLLRYDLTKNEIVHVARASSPEVSAREVTAGDTVRFRVRAADYETGVSAVYIQIKNPNSKQQSADGIEHKVYVPSNDAFNTGQAAVNVPHEVDCQAINPTDYSFRAPSTGGGGLPAGWPSPNKYAAGVDDQFAFSGSAHPPDAQFWLQLYDDGPVSKGGHEPEGETAGDGVYTANWTTPSTLPSDWYLDVIVYDRAVNPFDTTQQSNWKIYDNIWGFTTQPFQSRGQLLYVSDYDCGQRFFQTHFGVGTFFNLFFNGIPTESWMTEIDPNLLPTQWIDNSGMLHPLVDVQNTLGANSYRDALNDDGSGIPVTQRYDIWRILSRGPVPDAVLANYAAHVEIQPPDIISGGGSSRPVTVAERCIIWHAPYTGDLFVGPGTLLDGDTQTRLTNWVKGGGRLFVNGQDIAWGLTLGGSPGGNAFLSQVLKVNFNRDSAVPPVQNFQINLVNGRTTHPISTEYWSPSPVVVHIYLPFDNAGNDNPPSAGPIYLASIPNTPRQWSALNPGSPDVVDFLPAPATDVAQVDGTYSQGGSCITWFVDTTQHSKVVFSSAPWESINPETYSPGNNIIASKNRRTEMVHNVGDFLRTGRIIGQVRDVSGATPLGGVLVRAVSAYTGQTMATALTLGDGTYILNGLDATGIYSIDAFKPGFLAQHADGTFFHGGYQGVVNLFLTQAQPGSISGKVTRITDNQPVSGAVVQAQDVLTGDKFTATSGADGRYTITNVPASKYDITITNLNQLGYASSVPPSYQNVTVTAAQDTGGQDFQLKPLPGAIKGKVTKAGTTTPIAGATVTATPVSGTGAVSATTAADGTYTINNLDPGVYGVVASAPGYATSSSVSVTLKSQDTLTVDFALSTIPPGSISGLVTRTSDNQPVAGVTITLTDPNGNVVATGTTGAAQTVGGYTFNYKIDNVPAGQTLNASASLAGYTASPTTQGVTIQSGQETKGVNFTLEPLHTFSAQLSMVSAPYGYTTDVGDLLGIPASDRTNGKFLFFAWTGTSYVSYPTPPADTFHIGRGYFLAYTQNMALTTQGTSLPTTPGTPFKIDLVPGWNLIGDPFPFTLDFLSSKIELADGTQIDIPTAQGGPNPVIGGALWTLQNGQYQIAYTIEPWRGYWLRVFQPAKLVLDPAQQLNRSAKRNSGAATRAVDLDNASGQGWRLHLTARAGQVFSAPGYLGVNRAATNAYDKYKLEAPPLIGQQNVTLTFDHNDWADKSGKYSMDVRSATASTQQWEFTVTSNVPNTPVTLSWPNAAAVPGRNDLILTDLDTNTKMDLRARGSYTIPAGRSAITRHFRLEVRRAVRQPLELVNLSAHLNGGADGRAVKSVGISYMLTADATVQISIQQNGRHIRTVEPGRTRAAGSADATWDLTNDQGATVPSSLYTVEVRAIDKDGHMVRRSVPLLVPR